MSYGEEILSLHKYFIYANKMRTEYYNLFDANSKGLRKHQSFDVEELTFMSLWYGMLYVVTEGYKALKLQDTAIDVLLKSSHIKLLREFRNGTFHFQKNYFNKKFLGLIAEGGKSAKWIIDLHSAFSEFLLNEMKKVNASLDVVQEEKC